MSRQPLVVFVGFGLSITLGVGVQAYLAAQLGDSRLADVFYLGTALPTLIAVATLGSASSSLVRPATEASWLLSPFRRDSTGWALVRAAVAVSLTIVAIGAGVRTGVLGVSDSVAGRDLGSFLLATSLIPVLIAVTALATVLALTHDRFLLATWGGAVNGATLLGALLVLGADDLAPLSLAVAVDLGYVAQLSFVALAFRWLSPPPRVVSKSMVRAASKGMFLLIGASLIYKSQPLVEKTIGAAVGPGIPAALGYAEKITAGLSQLAVFGFSLVSLPAFARDMVADDHAAAASRLGSTLSATMVATATVIAFGLTSSASLVDVLFQRGEFSGEVVVTTQHMVFVSLISVAFGAAAAPIVALEYANHRVGHVVRIGLVGFVTGVVGSCVFAVFVGPVGIVAGTAAGFMATFVLFAVGTPSSLRGWSWRRFCRRRRRLAFTVSLCLLAGMAACQLIQIPADATTVAGLVGLAARFAVLAGASVFGLWIVEQPPWSRS